MAKGIVTFFFFIRFYTEAFDTRIIRRDRMYEINEFRILRLTIFRSLIEANE